MGITCYTCMKPRRETQCRCVKSKSRRKMCAHQRPWQKKVCFQRCWYVVNLLVSEMGRLWETGTLSGWAICPESSTCSWGLGQGRASWGLLDDHSRFRMQMKIQSIISKHTVVAESWEWRWRASRAPSPFDSIIEQVRSRVKEKSSGFKPSALFPSKVKPFAASNHLYYIPIQWPTSISLLAGCWMLLYLSI